MSKAKEKETESIVDVSKMIEKKYGKGLINPGTYIVENKKKTFSISPNFDEATGGVPEGSWVTLSGPSSCGKTTLALTIAQRLQADGREGYYIDAENRLKPMNFQGIAGLNPEKLHVIRSCEERILSGDDFLQIGTEILQNKKNCYLIIDSASSLCPTSEMESDVSGSIRSTTPKMFASFCRKNAGYVNTNNNVVIIIKHIITNTSGYGATFNEDGGVKLQFQADVRITTVRKPETWEHGGKIIGQIPEWTVLKSATGASNKTFKSYLRYGIGIDSIMEIVELAQDYGLIEKKGSWLYLNADTENEIKIQGSDNLREMLSEKPELLEELKKKINEIHGI